MSKHSDHSIVVIQSNLMQNNAHILSVSFRFTRSFVGIAGTNITTINIDEKKGQKVQCMRHSPGADSIEMDLEFPTKLRSILDHSNMVIESNFPMQNAHFSSVSFHSIICYSWNEQALCRSDAWMIRRGKRCNACDTVQEQTLLERFPTKLRSICCTRFQLLLEYRRRNTIEY